MWWHFIRRHSQSHPKNIINNRLIYQRQKTHGVINLLLTENARQIINKYTDYQKQADYFFPILHCKRHITPMQKITAYIKSVIKSTKNYEY